MNGPQTNGQPGAHPQPMAHPPLHSTAHPTIRPAPVLQPVHHPAAAPPAMPKPVQHGADDPISLEGDEHAPTDPSKSKIRAFSVAESHIGPHTWKRTPREHHTGACRVRSFHGRMSDQGMDYLDNAINEWLDKHPEIDVKFVTSNIGIFDGKIKDLALVLNVWY